jgi:hypothetical protein
MFGKPMLKMVHFSGLCKISILFWIQSVRQVLFYPSVSSDHFLELKKTRNKKPQCPSALTEVVWPRPKSPSTQSPSSSLMDYLMDPNPSDWSRSNTAALVDARGLKLELPARGREARAPARLGRVVGARGLREQQGNDVHHASTMCTL